MSKNWQLCKWLTPPIHPDIGEGVSTDHKSSNRIDQFKIYSIVSDFDITHSSTHPYTGVSQQIKNIQKEIKLSQDLFNCYWLNMTHPFIQPLIGGGVSTNHKFSKRIELSQISRSGRIPYCWFILVVIVKLWFSVLLNLKSHIITHPRVTNDDAPSNLWKPLKCTVKWV